jgi:hypothetical protein
MKKTTDLQSFLGQELDKKDRQLHRKSTIDFFSLPPDGLRTQVRSHKMQIPYCCYFCLEQKYK